MVSASRSILLLSKGILALIIVVVIAAIVALLALRRESVRTDIGNSLLARIPLSGALLSAEQVDFDLQGNAELRGVLFSDQDSTIVRADTLRVKGDILRIAGGTIDFDEIHIAHAFLDLESLRQYLKRISSPDSQPGEGRDFLFRRVALREVGVRNAEVVLKTETSEARARFLAADFVRSFEGTLEIDGRPEGHHVKLEVDSLQAKGRFGATDTIPADIQARGTYDSPKIHADRLEIRTERSSLDLRGDIEIADGRVDFDHAHVELAAHPLSLEDAFPLLPRVPETGSAQIDARLAEGTIEGNALLDLAEGDLAVTSFAFDIGDLPSWKAQLELGPSDWRRRSISFAHVDATSAGDAIDLAANVRARGGDVRLRGRMTEPGENALLEIREAVFRRLDLAVWTGRQDLASSLNGSLTGKGRGLQPRTMRFTGTALFQSSEMAGVRIDSGRIEGSLDQGILQSKSRFVQDTNEVGFSGTVEPWAKPLRAQGIAQGKGTFRGTAVDTIFAGFRMAGSMAHVDTLTLRSPVADAQGSGDIAWSRSAPAGSSFHLHANLKDVSPLAQQAHLDTLAVSSGVLDLELEGRIQQPIVHASLQADSVLAGSTRLLQLKALVDSDVSGRSAAFDVAAMNDSSRATQAKGQFTHVRDSAYPYRFEVETLQFPVQSEEWRLDAPASIAFGASRARVHEAQLSSGAAQVEIDGTLDRAGSQDLRIEVRSLDTKTLTALLKRHVPEGVLDANLEVQGPAAAARAGGDIHMALRSEEEDHGTLTIQGTMENSSARVEGRIEAAEGSFLDFTGTLPYALSLATPPPGESWKPVRETGSGMDLSVKADQFSLAAFEPLFSPDALHPIEGNASVDLRMTGDPSAPDGTGFVRIEKGRVGHPPWDVVYEDIQGEVVLEGNRLAVRELSATSGKGRLSASGEMALSQLKPGDFTLNVNLENFRVMNSTNLHFDASGRADLVRSGKSLSLTGDLVAEELEVFVTFSTLGRGRQPIEFTDEDREMIVQTFGPRALEKRSTLVPDALRSAAVDLNVTAHQNAWVRQRRAPRIAGEVAGQIRVRKAPEQKFEYFGELRALPGRGYVEHFGRRFEIIDGELILEGNPRQAQFRAEGMHRVIPHNDPSQTPVEITLTFEGRPSDYEVHLSSDPAMPASEITTLLATGSTTQSNVLASESVNREAAGIALQVGLTDVTGAVEEAAQEAVGLDVVQIRQDGLRGATLVAGEYIRPRVYFGLRQPVMFEQDEVRQTADTGKEVQVEVEYMAHRRLTLNFRGEGDAFRLVARSRYAY